MVGCLLVARFPLACELVDHSELAGLPAAVAGESGRVLAVSPEAEGWGVGPDLTIREAIGRCPGLAVLEERGARYHARWAEILAALERVAFTLEPAGQGEAYVRVDELVSHHRSPEGVLAALLGCVDPDLGPRAGAAPTRFAALLAARQASSGGALVVDEKELAGFLARQPVTALPVTPEMLRRLGVLRMTTLGELRALPRSALAAQFGPEGALAWDLAWGRDRSPLRPLPHQTRMAESLRLETPLVSRPAILAAWEETLGRLGRRWELQGLAARQVELRAATERGRQWARSITFKEPLAHIHGMWSAVCPVLEEARFPGPLAELTAELHGLAPAGGQQLALPSVRATMRARLEEGMRQLKARYGYCPLGRVVEMEPWSRIPERRLALVDFDV
jgi:nucleotidyltransferase/DNA polymerase involved in DNA repair